MKPFRAQVKLNSKSQSCIVVDVDHGNAEFLCVIDDKSSDEYGKFKYRDFEDFSLSDQQIQQLEVRINAT